MRAGPGLPPAAALDPEGATSVASDAEAASSHDEESSEEDAWARGRRGESVGRRSTAGAPCSAQKPAARASINRAVASLTLAGAAGNSKAVRCAKSGAEARADASYGIVTCRLDGIALRLEPAVGEWSFGKLPGAHIHLHRHDPRRPHPVRPLRLREPPLHRRLSDGQLWHSGKSRACVKCAALGARRHLSHTRDHCSPTKSNPHADSPHWPRAPASPPLSRAAARVPLCFCLWVPVGSC